MPICRRTCPEHRAPHDSEDSESEDYYEEVDEEEGGPCSLSCASSLFQLLAAAAPLAGVDAELAWDPGALETILSGAATAAPPHAAEGIIGGDGPVAAAGVRPDDKNEPLAKRVCLHQRGGSSAAESTKRRPADGRMIAQLAVTVSHAGGGALPFLGDDYPAGPGPRAAPVVCRTGAAALAAPPQRPRI